MPTSDLSPQERLALITRLNALPDASFKMLVFSLHPPASILPSDLAAQGNRTFTLLEWVESTGPGLSLLQDILNQITGEPLVEKQTKLAATDWATLFSYFSPYDFAMMHTAFLKAFQAVYTRGFWQMRPDNPPLTEPGQIQKLIANYDNPVLAVRFVELVVVMLQQTEDSNLRDLSDFEQWRDRIAHRFNVPDPPPPPPQNPGRYAYLLITLEPNGSQVIAYPELRLTGQDKSIPFGAQPTTAPADNLAEPILQWIDLAEEALGTEDCSDGEVTLEVFLPSQCLVNDVIREWQVTDPLSGAPMELLNYRRLIVRSADRAIVRKPALRRQIQQRLEQNWQRLKACVDNRTVCSEFHVQRVCPTQAGELRVLLTDKPGLKFIAPWPTEEEKQTWLLGDIIHQAIPIAMWSKEATEADADTLRTEFDALLQGCQLTSFVELADLWRRRRANSAVAKPIKLLCDRPDRLPRLPDSGRDEDALVSPA